MDMPEDLGSEELHSHLSAVEALAEELDAKHSSSLASIVRGVRCHLRILEGVAAEQVVKSRQDLAHLRSHFESALKTLAANGSALDRWLSDALHSTLGRAVRIVQDETLAGRRLVKEVDDKVLSGLEGLQASFARYAQDLAPFQSALGEYHRIQESGVRQTTKSREKLESLRLLLASYSNNVELSKVPQLKFMLGNATEILNRAHGALDMGNATHVNRTPGAHGDSYTQITPERLQRRLKDAEKAASAVDPPATSLLARIRMLLSVHHGKAADRRERYRNRLASFIVLATRHGGEFGGEIASQFAEVLHVAEQELTALGGSVKAWTPEGGPNKQSSWMHDLHCAEEFTSGEAVSEDSQSHLNIARTLTHVVKTLDPQLGQELAHVTGSIRDRLLIMEGQLAGHVSRSTVNLQIVREQLLTLRAKDKRQYFWLDASVNKALRLVDQELEVLFSSRLPKDVEWQTSHDDLSSLHLDSLVHRVSELNATVGSQLQTSLLSLRHNFRRWLNHTACHNVKSRERLELLHERLTNDSLALSAVELNDSVLEEARKMVHQELSQLGTEPDTLEEGHLPGTRARDIFATTHAPLWRELLERSTSEVADLLRAVRDEVIVTEGHVAQESVRLHAGMAAIYCKLSRVVGHRNSVTGGLHLEAPVGSFLAPAVKSFVDFVESEECVFGRHHCSENTSGNTSVEERLPSASQFLPVSEVMPLVLEVFSGCQTICARIMHLVQPYLTGVVFALFVVGVVLAVCKCNRTCGHLEQLGEPAASETAAGETAAGGLNEVLMLDALETLNQCVSRLEGLPHKEPERSLEKVLGMVQGLMDDRDLERKRAKEKRTAFFRMAGRFLGGPVRSDVVFLVLRGWAEHLQKVKRESVLLAKLQRASRMLAQNRGVLALCMTAWLRQIEKQRAESDLAEKVAAVNRLEAARMKVLEKTALLLSDNPRVTCASILQAWSAHAQHTKQLLYRVGSAMAGSIQRALMASTFNVWSEETSAEKSHRRQRMQREIERMRSEKTVCDLSSAFDRKGTHERRLVQVCVWKVWCIIVLNGRLDKPFEVSLRELDARGRHEKSARESCEMSDSDGSEEIPHVTTSV